MVVMVNYPSLPNCASLWTPIIHTSTRTHTCYWLVPVVKINCLKTLQLKDDSVLLIADSFCTYVQQKRISEACMFVFLPIVKSCGSIYAHQWVTYTYVASSSREAASLTNICVYTCTSDRHASFSFLPASYLSSSCCKYLVRICFMGVSLIPVVPGAK